MNHPEHQLSHYVNTLMDRILLEPCWPTAVETGTVMVNKSPVARMNWEQKRRAMGIKPHALDWMCFQRFTDHPGGLLGMIELKIKPNNPTAGQLVTMQLLSARGIPNAVCWSISDVYRFLVEHGYRLHGNAANIAEEIEARWHVAGMRNAPPKKASKPRVGKPTLARVRRLEAVRGRVLY